MKKSILASCVLLLSLASYAVNERGNGGDVVVCQNQNGKVTNIQMLDLYEAWQLRGQLPKLGGENLNFDEKVSLLISRIEKQTVGISQIIKTEI